MWQVLGEALKGAKLSKGEGCRVGKQCGRVATSTALCFKTVLELEEFEVLMKTSSEKWHLQMALLEEEQPEKGRIWNSERLSSRRHHFVVSASRCSQVFSEAVSCLWGFGSQRMWTLDSSNAVYPFPRKTWYLSLQSQIPEFGKLCWRWPFCSCFPLEKHKHEELFFCFPTLYPIIRKKVMCFSGESPGTV